MYEGRAGGRLGWGSFASILVDAVMGPIVREFFFSG